jgi:glycosyltransferase involved in cell wall biosynthesis
VRLLSIIVPIYNVETYIEKCIRSLEVQNISKNDYEIICINDGSPDASREIVLSLQKEFENIVLIDQDNQGVSRARNNGIEKATGKYLMFIDPDDFVTVNSLDRLLKTIESRGAQLAIVEYIFLNQDGSPVGTRTCKQYEGKVFTGIEAYFLIREKGQIQADLAIGILFELDFLKNNYLRYLPDVSYLEDGEFLARVHCLAQRCIFISDPFYINVVRLGSATHSELFVSEKARKGLQLAASNLKNFQMAGSLNPKQALFMNKPIAQFVFLTLYSAIRTRSIRKLLAAVNSLKVSGLGKLRYEGCTGYYPRCIKAYNVSPYFGIIVLGLYLKVENQHQPWLLKIISRKLHPAAFCF